MKINHNDSAVITNVKLLRNEKALTAAMERLSTGFKINHAVDNPSGMAISNKMQAQINGLDQASRNSSDGLSVLETADGALQELTAIMQRIRELAVQAANDTNAPEDRDSIQTEIDELAKEIDRISEASEFNTKSLLDGSLDTHVYGDHATRRYVSDGVVEGHYKMSIETPASQTVFSLGTAALQYDGGGRLLAGSTGVLDIGGSKISLKEGMTKDEVDEAIRKGAERADVIYDYENGSPTRDHLISKSYGVSSKILVSASEELAAKLGISTTAEDNMQDTAKYKAGKDAEIALDYGADSAFKDHPGATIKQTDNRVIITDANGFEMSFKLEAGYDKTHADKGIIDLEVTDKGPMDIQVGANARQQIPVRIPSVSTESMYLENINVRTHITASKAISDMDNAINYVNTARAKIGSYSNRLEHTVLSTDNTEENMTAAISRIKDVDMAEEMTEYTKQNVLVQAATSALSQANEIPQMALQLLS